MTDRLPLPIKFKIKDKDQMTKDAVDYFKEHRKLKPVFVGFTIEYAEVVEYGCGPLNDYQPTVNGGNYNYKTIFDAIYEWAGKKDGKGSVLPIRDEKERYRFAKNVTDHFFMYGMRAHPYWRPAMQWLQENMQKRFDEGLSLYQIADEALRIAKKNIKDQNLPYNGGLEESGLVKEIKWKEIGDVRLLRDWSEDERNDYTRYHTGWGADQND